MISHQAVISYFKSLESVRERNSLLLKYPQYLQSFNLDLSKVDSVVDKVLDLINRDYASPSDIPPHSRWRHFDVGGIQRINHLISNSWASLNEKERVKRLIDLFVVSVLLDAGAGDTWKYNANDSPYTQQTTRSTFNRSEGLAVGSLEWFLKGGFSSKGLPECDSKGLAAITVQQLQREFQVTSDNPLVGSEGRCELLQRLGTVCESFPQFFQDESGVCRPGNLVDYLLKHATVSDSTLQVDILLLWNVVIEGFAGIWPPTRTSYQGVSLGDVWPCEALLKIAELNPTETCIHSVPQETRHYVTFHKLSQWLTYSLMEPLALLGIEFKGVDKMTGLAEYRNGGLFVDMNVIELKAEIKIDFHGEIPQFQVYDDTVVEWRALTVALLDLVGAKVRQRLGMSEKDLPLVKVLEAGTWKAGREVAAVLRPLSKGPPIKIISDGTVF